MYHQTSGQGNVILQSELAQALTAIDERLLEGKEKLEVNRKGRKVPYYQFVPSHHHPEPWGHAPGGFKERQVHKQSGKAKDNRRKGKK